MPSLATVSNFLCSAFSNCFFLFFFIHSVPNILSFFFFSSNNQASWILNVVCEHISAAQWVLFTSISTRQNVTDQSQAPSKIYETSHTYSETAKLAAELQIQFQVFSFVLLFCIQWIICIEKERNKDDLAAWMALIFKFWDNAGQMSPSQKLFIHFCFDDVGEENHLEHFHFCLFLKMWHVVHFPFRQKHSVTPGLSPVIMPALLSWRPSQSDS